RTACSRALPSFQHRGWWRTRLLRHHHRHPRPLDREGQPVTDFETILLDRKGRVGIVTLNRPKALNALNSQLMREVVAAVEELDADGEIGAILLTGSEKAFAAGADIKER